MASPFVPPSPSQWEGPSSQVFTPPPVSSWEGEDKRAKSKGFLGELWNEVKNGPANLLQVGNSINNAVLHPGLTVNAMGDQIANTARRAKEAWNSGDYAGAAAHAINTGINALVPGLGTSSDDAGNMLANGDYAGGAGKTLGLGINTALGIKAPQIAKGAATAAAETITPGVTGPAGRLLRADPTVAATRALRPTPSDPGFSDRLPQTLSNVKGANPGAVPETNAQLTPAVEKAIQGHQSVLDQWFQRAKGVRISGDPIVEATAKSTEGMLPSESGSAENLVQRAMQDYGTDFTPDELKARLELLNKRLDPFYSKNPGKQSAALADIPDAVLKAQRDAVADTLYRALDPEGEGAGPRLIQRQIGDMIDLKDASLRRKNAIIAEQPVSPIGQIGDVVKRARGAVSPSKSGIAFSDSPKSDPLIRRAFQAVDDPNAIPQPGSPLYPTGDTNRLLTEGDIITPPPSDTSSVSAVPGARQTPQAEPSVIPPGRAGRVIDMATQPAPRGASADAEWWARQPLTNPELQARYRELFSKAENLSPQKPVQAPESGTPEAVTRGVDARENIARQVLRGKPLGDATPTERNVIDQLVSEGYGSAPPRFARGGIAGIHGPEKVIVGDGGEPEAIVPLSHIRSLEPHAQKHLLRGIGAHLGIVKPKKFTLGSELGKGLFNIFQEKRK